MIVPLRNLSKYGVLPNPDTAKFNIPPEAWSFGVNVRFTNGSVERAPVFRSAGELLFTDPRFLATSTPSTGFDSVIIGYKNGRVTSWSSGTEDDQSITGYVDADAETPFTSVTCNDVLYVNREDRVPWYFTPSATDFTAIAQDWDSTWRAGIIRSLNGALVTLKVSQGAVVYPAGIMTSEFTEAGAVPSTWDYTDPTNNATFNSIDIRGDITDAQNLGDALFVYSRRETWVMTLDPGSEAVWSYHRRFSDAGSINADCSVEVDGKQFVFGPTDIWVHDGHSKDSICDERTRRFIYSSINASKAHRCKVHHNENLKELYFCYVSGDRAVNFTGDGCNRAAVFNLSSKTWTFYDLPLIFGLTFANLDTILTYATTGATYASIGGAYLDQEDGLKKVTVMVGDVSAAHSLTASLYAFDLPNTGSLVAYDVDENATGPVTLEKDGLDLDELAAKLRGYKVCTSLYPQATLDVSADPLEFRFGGADYFNNEPSWSEWQTYDGDELYKLDYTTAGRFLSFQMRHSDWHEFVLSGVDLDIDVLGDR